MAVNDSSLERRVIVAASLAHATTHSLELTFAALLVRIGVDFGVDLAVLGVVANAGAFTFGATALPSGFLSDRLGPRVVIAGCLGAAAIFAMLVAAAPNVWVLAVLLALLGAAIGLYHPAGTAMVATASERRGMAFAAHGIFGNVGVAIVPALAAGIAIGVGWRGAYVVLGLAAIAAAVTVWRLAPGRDDVAAAAGRVMARRAASGRSLTTPPHERRWLALPLVLVFVCQLGTGFIYRGALTFLPAHFEEHLDIAVFGWSAETVAGAMATAVLFTAIGGHLLGGSLSDRIPVERVAVPMVLAVVPSLALVGIVTGPALLAVTAAFVVFNFAQQPIFNGLISDYAPAGSTGRAYGVSFFMTFGLGSIAGSITGVVADSAGTGAAFLMLAGVAAGLAAVTMAVAAGAERRRAGLLAGEAISAAGGR